MFHGLVVLDILLESLLIPLHEGLGFLLSATGFAFVVGSYHALAVRQLNSAKPVLTEAAS